MNRVVLGCGILLVGSLAFGPVASAGTNQIQVLRSFELPDQSNARRRVEFPRTNLLVLTVADQKGAEQVAGWVRPLKERFGEGLAIEGVADVSKVPGLLRPLVRREFKRKFTHPIMLDWSGDLAKSVNALPDQVAVLALATNGQVLGRMNGPADTNRLALFIQLLSPNGTIQPAESPR